MNVRKIILVSDHAGWRLKEHLKSYLETAGHQLADAGCLAPVSCDYPLMAQAAGARVAAGEFEFGIFVCGTGLGIGMAANKIPGIRAAVCTCEYMAAMARSHNDANVICLGERVIGFGIAETIVRRFLETDFEGGRHQRRVNQMQAMEGGLSALPQVEAGQTGAEH